MARPNKNNAEYFSHDADMRNDVKVKALRRKFGHVGYAVWCFILEALTDGDDFEVEYDKVNRELLAADFDIPVNQLEEIVEYCTNINLLQLSGESRLYSEAHKRRFDALMLEREKKSMAGKLGMAKRWGKQSEINNTVITADNTPITADNKVEKSKVKDSKVKKSKIEYPYQDIADLWNKVCTSLPQVRVVNDNRRNKIKCRLNEFGKTQDEWLEKTEDLFNRVQGSKFLRGETSSWAATFDWLFDNSTNWVKVMEGNYSDGRGNRPAGKTGGTTDNGGLGVGEFLDRNGRRTYGTGKATIPPTAPPRPGDKYSWDELSQTWIML